MNYRLFRKEIELLSLLGKIIDFEAPENLYNIHVEPTIYNHVIAVVGLESYGEVEYPKKKYKLMILDESSTVSHTVNYEPKIIDCGRFVIGNGKTFYSYLLS